MRHKKLFMILHYFKTSITTISKYLLYLLGLLLIIIPVSLSWAQEGGSLSSYLIEEAPSKLIAQPAVIIFCLLSIILGLIILTRSPGKSTPRKIIAIISIIWGVFFVYYTFLVSISAFFFIVNNQLMLNFKYIQEQVIALMFLLVPSFFFIIGGFRLYKWKFRPRTVSIITLSLSFLFFWNYYNTSHIPEHASRVAYPIDSLIVSEEKPIDTYEQRIPSKPIEHQIVEKESSKTEITDEQKESTDDLNLIPEKKNSHLVKTVLLTNKNYLYIQKFWGFFFGIIGLVFIFIHIKTRRKKQSTDKEIYMITRQNFVFPFFKIWFSPRDAYVTMRNYSFKLHLSILIVTCSYFVIVGFNYANSAAAEEISFSNIILKSIIFSFLGGIVILPLFAFGLQKTGKLFGGKGKLKDNVIAITTSILPMFLLMPFWIIILFIFKDNIFYNEIRYLKPSISLPAFLTIFILLYNIASFWQLIISLHCISEANKISKLKTFFSLILLIILITLLLILIKIVF